MTYFLEQIIIYNHFMISGILISLLIFIYFQINNLKILSIVLKFLLILNFSTFYIYLLSTGNFSFKIHLPLHLCYLTELGILIALLFRLPTLYPWLVLNSLGGGITGFTNSNLTDEALLIERIHLYLSHFNLLLFSLFIFKQKLIISKPIFLKSIIFNSSLFILVVIFNKAMGSNYWFTNHKPPGTNLTLLLPDWPYYVLILISIGLISYYITFKLLLINKR